VLSMTLPVVTIYVRSQTDPEWTFVGMGSKSITGWPITSASLPYDCVMVPELYDADRLRNPPLIFSRTQWSINGGDMAPWRGGSEGSKFVIKPSVFGFQLGTNTLTAHVDMMDGLWSNKGDPEDQFLTESIEITFIEGGC